MPCSCCEITNEQFDESSAESDLKEYRKKGPAKHTRLILEAARSLNVKEAFLLDVGGGVGAIYHELLGNVASKAIHVDASAAYLNSAKEETEKRGNNGKVEFIHADFTDIADSLPEVDVATLDRVVCCYPDFRALLGSAAGRAKKAIVMTYPQDVWAARIVVKIANFIQKIRKDPFRVFVHPVADMQSLLNERGFSRTSVKRIFIWEMSLYQKA